MKLGYVIIALLCISTAAALQELTVERGETLLIISNTHTRGPLYEISADYSIPEIGFHYMNVDTNPSSSTVEQEVGLDAPAGTYLMTVTIKVNRELAFYEKILVTITDEEQEQVVRTQSKTVRAETGAITIQPIPDVSPGTTLVLPVLITGKGTYQLELPRLDFATYETPEPITINGSGATSLLLHIHEDAKPGVYTVPVSAGSENTTVRIRVIKYVEHKQAINWYLIGGIALILLGILFLLALRAHKKHPRTPVRESKKDDDELITYY